MNWYALFVKTGNEDKVKLRLEYRFRGEPEVFIPKRLVRERKAGIWRERVRSLFPGYVLMRGEITPKVLMQLWNVPDLFMLLKQDCRPVTIPEEEVDVFRHLMDGMDTIGLSTAIAIGDRIEFISGPLSLTEMKGQVVDIDKRKGRAKVKFTFLGEERVLPFSFEMLAPAEDAEVLDQDN